MGKCASNPIKHVLFNSTFQKKKKKNPRGFWWFFNWYFIILVSGNANAFIKYSLQNCAFYICGNLVIYTLDLYSPPPPPLLYPQNLFNKIQMLVFYEQYNNTGESRSMPDKDKFTWLLILCQSVHFLFTKSFCYCGRWLVCSWICSLVQELFYQGGFGM